jgi:hypothetical protein
MSYDVPRECDDLQPGDVVVWQTNGRASGSPLRITRRGKDGHSWLAVRLRPETWESAGQEWLIHWNQIAHGKYARLLYGVQIGQRQ